MDFIRSEGIAERQHLIMGNSKLTEHAQNLQGCEKCNLRKAVGNLEMPYGCEAQEGLKNCYTSKLYKVIKVIVQEELKTCILVQEGLINSYI